MRLWKFRGASWFFYGTCSISVSIGFCFHLLRMLQFGICCLLGRRSVYKKILEGSSAEQSDGELEVIVQIAIENGEDSTCWRPQAFFYDPVRILSKPSSNIHENAHVETANFSHLFLQQHLHPPNFIPRPTLDRTLRSIL